MLARALTALTIAICATFATTGITSAAIEIGDRNDVMLLTAIFWGALMVITFIFYLVKHALGLDKMPPAPAEDPHAHH